MSDINENVPILSVVIPVSNAEKYLKEAVDSIINQTFQDFEVIFVDDHSTDNTLEIINSYNNEKFKVLQRTKRDLASALNTGIDAARGKYIARMDSDDFSMPQRFEKQIEYMDANPDISICGTWAVLYYEQTKQQVVASNPVEDKDIKAHLFSVCPFIHPSVMFRKSSLDKFNLRYSSDVEAAEDLELWIRASEFVNFHNIPEPLFIYRIHGNNESVTGQDKTKSATHKLYQSNFKKIFNIEVGDDIISAFRPAERANSVYSLEQLQRIVAVMQEMINLNKQFEDKYNTVLFEKYILDGLQTIIQKNQAVFASK